MNDPRHQWFIERIGKRVYRNSNGCSCNVCEDIRQNGIKIEDEMHAEYMYQMEGSANLDGLTLRYFDTKEEVIISV